MTKLEEILNGLHPTYQTAKLKRLMLDAGVIDNVCTECGVAGEYNGKPIALHLDHINGKSDDHRRVNLRMLCPNCHSQTSTYSGRNKQNVGRTKLADKKQARKDKAKELKDAKDAARMADYTAIEKSHGWVATLARKWRVSHTSVRKFLDKNMLSKH